MYENKGQQNIELTKAKRSSGQSKKSLDQNGEMNEYNKELIRLEEQIESDIQIDEMRKRKMRRDGNIKNI